MSKSSRPRTDRSPGGSPDAPTEGRSSRRDRRDARGSNPRAPRAAVPTRAGGLDRGDLLAALLLVAVCVIVFANGVGNQFVWDDKKQIVQNDLIKDPRYFGKALMSDVWAFKGDTGEAWSNYWRPVFILWMIANYRAFGLTNTAGWHVGNIVLHAGVAVLAFWFLRRLGLSRAIALAIALLFTVHPVHVESVTWIAGSPDLFVASGLLAALIFLLMHMSQASGGTRTGPWLLVGAVATFTVSLLSKEISIFFPAIVFVVALLAGSRGPSLVARAKSAALLTLPFVIATGIYAVVHYLILRKLQIEVPWQVGPAGFVLSAPSILFFYLREALFPLWIAPAYTVRAVAQPGLTNFLLPAAVVGAAFAGLFWLGRRDAVRGIGLALFLVPVLPALNINAFAPDRIVADRYLYLPSLGLFMILVPSLVELIAWVTGRTASAGAPSATTAAPGGRAAERSRDAAGGPGILRAERSTFWIAAVAAALLALQTVRYNRAWESELTLWTAAIASDPDSASALNEYAVVMYQSGRLDEARAALDHALSIAPLTTATLLSADVATAQKRYADAEGHIKKVISIYPDNAGAYERLALLYQMQGRLPEAESTLRTAIVQASHRRGAFTDSLGIVLYLEGRREDALATLEAGRDLAANEMNPGAQSILFHLGTLYSEMGRTAEARRALEAYLRVSARSADKQTQTQQAKAQAALQGLPRNGN